MEDLEGGGDNKKML